MKNLPIWNGRLAIAILIIVIAMALFKIVDPVGLLARSPAIEEAVEESTAEEKKADEIENDPKVNVGDVDNRWFIKAWEWAPNAPNEDNEPPDERADLQAQQQIAGYTFVIAAVSTLSLLVSGVAAMFIYRTFNTTRQMALDTRRIGEAQVRAYLFIPDLELEQLAGDGICRIFVQNSGQSPGINVKVFVAAVIDNVPGLGIAHRQIYSQRSIAKVAPIAASQRAEIFKFVFPQSSLDEIRKSRNPQGLHLTIKMSVDYETVFTGPSDDKETITATFRTNPGDGIDFGPLPRQYP